ncbi:MAG TPA: hypothetical protein VE440_07745 [Gaiellaceae bacterium]|nr:hypothetical protein [Gaiellaceae bacterium]
MSALALLAAAALLAACGSDDSPGDAQPSEKEPPTVAELVCSGGPELLTPIVRGRKDGVHIRLHNETNREVELDFELTRGGTRGGGSVAPPGTSEHAPHGIGTVEMCADFAE